MQKLALKVTGIDSILGGGLEPEIITTVYGASGCGKTNFALQAVLSCIKAGKKAVFIDPEGSFSVERYLQAHTKEGLENIILYNPKTFDEQASAIAETAKISKTDRIGLIVVDSIVALYRIHTHEADIAKANSMLSKQFAELSMIAREHKIPVLVTNQVYSDFGSGELELVGRDIPKYSSRCLIHIERASGTKRKATIIKHRSQPEGGSAEFLIKNEGLVDAGKKFGIF